MRQSVIYRKLFPLVLCLLALCYAPAPECLGQVGNKAPSLEPADAETSAEAIEAIRNARRRAVAGRRRWTVKRPVLDGVVGVTVMRKRPANTIERDKASASGNKNEGTVFARIEDDTPLAPGDKLRIAVEASFDGHLYVVDRELYADGTMGRALLLFPALSSYDGDSDIEPGKPRVIPGPDVEMQVNPKNQGRVQIAERLTIIVSPTRLTLPQRLSSHEMELPPGLLEKWEMNWGTKAKRTSSPDRTDQVPSEREQAAGRTRKKEIGILTPNDPLPQNIYSVKVRHRKPTLIVLVLQYKAPDAPPTN